MKKDCSFAAATVNMFSAVNEKIDFSTVALTVKKKSCLICLISSGYASCSLDSLQRKPDYLCFCAYSAGRSGGQSLRICRKETWFLGGTASGNKEFPSKISA